MSESSISKMDVTAYSSRNKSYLLVKILVLHMCLEPPAHYQGMTDSVLPSFGAKTSQQKVLGHHKQFAMFFPSAIQLYLQVVRDNRT